MQFIAFSLPALHHERQPAMVREIAIVFEAGDLQRAQFDFSGSQIPIRVYTACALRLKVDGPHGAHSGDGPGRGVHRAQINRLTESEVVREEESLLAVRQDLIAEDGEQRLLDIALEVVRIDADLQVDLQRDILRRY